MAAMSKILAVSRSGFYGWQKRPESNRSKEERLLYLKICAAFEAAKRTPGSLKLMRHFRALGERYGKNRIARIMRKYGLKSVWRKKFRPPKTTNSNHKLDVSPNLLAQNFNTDRPDQIWVSDITYLWSRSGWLYLTVIKDLFSARIVGWSLSTSLHTASVIYALENAVRLRRPPPGLIFHSDQGIQYCSHKFRRRLEDFQITQSMSRRGNCYDNAPAESFHASLKMEFTNHQSFDGLEEARSAIFWYIECFYNRQRLHSRADYMSPSAYEEKYAA
jgi:putative transposase